jgi:hypothetical protein
MIRIDYCHNVNVSKKLRLVSLTDSSLIILLLLDYLEGFLMLELFTGSLKIKI